MNKEPTQVQYQFKPLFDHGATAVLQGLCRDFSDGFSFDIEANPLGVDAILPAHPNSEVITSLMRAIKNRFAIRCQYVSLNSGITFRELVPHAIINNGHRWHTRAYDRQAAQFKDFVCSRFSQLEVLIDPAQPQEQRAQDKEWNRIVTVKLIPHPKLKVPQAIEMDYRMTDGQLTLELRAAMVGYLMQKWHVDCSIEHKLNCAQYQLALANPQAFKHINNLALAPGYQT